VTLAGTTLSIKYLRDRGYLRTTSEVKEKLKEAGEEYRDRFDDEWEKSWQRFAGKRNKDKEEKQ